MMTAREAFNAMAPLSIEAVEDRIKVTMQGKLTYELFDERELTPVTIRMLKDNGFDVDCDPDSTMGYYKVDWSKGREHYSLWKAVKELFLE